LKLNNWESIDTKLLLLNKLLKFWVTLRKTEDVWGHSDSLFFGQTSIFIKCWWLLELTTSRREFFPHNIIDSLALMLAKSREL